MYKIIKIINGNIKKVSKKHSIPKHFYSSKTIINKRIHKVILKG